jgi:hypothetical protein
MVVPYREIDIAQLILLVCHEKEASIQFDATAALSPGKESILPLEYEDL